MKNWHFLVRDYLFFSTDCNILVLVLWWYWFERLACSSGHDAGTLLVNVLEPGIWYSVFMFSEFEKKNQWRGQKIWQIMKESLVQIALKPFLHGNAAQGAKNFFKNQSLKFLVRKFKKKFSKWVKRPFPPLIHTTGNVQTVCKSLFYVCFTTLLLA